MTGSSVTKRQQDTVPPMQPTTREDLAHWSKTAEDWIAWARQPGHDPYWAYETRLEAFVGHGIGAALEIGCGEGRVSRLLGKCGYTVTATDPVDTFVTAARTAGSANRYAVCPADSLPFADNSFDLAAAYNVLMDVEDVPASLKEVGRVLRPGGTLIVSIVHPFADIGQFSGEGTDAPFAISRPYFGRNHFCETVERDGLTMSFFGWSQPLEAYFSALEATGFAVTSLKEPTPDPARAPRLPNWHRLPLFLWMKCRRLS